MDETTGREPTAGDGGDGSEDDAGDTGSGVGDDPGPRVEDGGGSDDAPTVAALVDELEALGRTATTDDRRERLLATARMAAAIEAGQPPVFGRTIVGFDRADAGEAFLGATLFAVPMAVEGGTLEVAGHLAATPLALVGTAAVTVALVVGILYVADIQDVRVHRPFLGVVPRRLVGVLAIAVGTAAGLLAAWGRLPAGAPTVAMAEVVVATLPAAVGAALGDILPGS